MKRHDDGIPVCEAFDVPSTADALRMALPFLECVYRDMGAKAGEDLPYLISAARAALAADAVNAKGKA